MSLQGSQVALSLLSVVGVVLCTVAADVYRRWDNPDRRLLSAFLGVYGATGIVVGVAGIVAPEVVLVERNGQTWLQSVIWPVTAAAFPWGVFVLRYTGQGEVVLANRWRTAAVGVVSMGAFSWQFLGRLVASGSSPGLPANAAFVVIASLLPLLWLLFVGGGFVALFRTTHRYDYLGRAHRASLGLAPIVPILAISAGFQFRETSLALTVGSIAVGFATSCVLVGLAVYRYGVLEASPAAGNIGREAVVTELDDLMVLVDGDGRVVDANPAAREALAVDADELPEVSVSTVLGTGLETVREQDVIELPTAEGRCRYDARVSTLTNAEGEPAGHAVTLRDVTRRAIREQRLAVLNRVLRHNLRNKLTVARGVAGIAVDGEVPPPSLAEDLEESTEDLLTLGEKAREVERRMEQARIRDEPVDLTAVVASVVAEAGEKFPDATVETEVPPDLAVQGDPNLLEYVLSNLVENGVVHNDDDPTVTVRAAETPDPTLPVVVSVEDDGPGIPDHERQVIESGTETALEHGSGLGLWIARWGAMRLGGEIRFRDIETGTAVEIRLSGPPE